MVGPEHGGVGTATRAGQLVPLYNPFMPLDSRLFLQFSPAALWSQLNTMNGSRTIAEGPVDCFVFGIMGFPYIPGVNTFKSENIFW